MLPGDLVESAQPKKVIRAVEEEIILKEQVIEEVVVAASEMVPEESVKPVKELQKNELFEGYDRIEE